MGIKAHRISEIMVETSYICPDHFKIALGVQAQRDRQGKKHIRLGEIMASDGFITRSQLRKVLAEQERRGKSQ